MFPFNGDDFGTLLLPIPNPSSNEEKTKHKYDDVHVS